jgi:hypothetical protein
MLPNTRYSIYYYCKLNVYGSVHRKDILIYVQQDATLHSLFYLETALHVSSGTTIHHQERKQLYLQHLVFVTPLLQPAAIVEELELVWVCCGWRTPPTVSNSEYGVLLLGHFALRQGFFYPHKVYKESVRTRTFIPIATALILQGEHKFLPWLQTFITKKLRGYRLFFFKM